MYVYIYIFFLTLYVDISSTCLFAHKKKRCIQSMCDLIPSSPSPPLIQNVCVATHSHSINSILLTSVCSLSSLSSVHTYTHTHTLTQADLEPEHYLVCLSVCLLTCPPVLRVSKIACSRVGLGWHGVAVQGAALSVWVCDTITI